MSEQSLAELVREYDDVAAATRTTMTREQDRRLRELGVALSGAGVDMDAYTEEAVFQLSAGLDLLSLAGWLCAEAVGSPAGQRLAGRLLAGLGAEERGQLWERVLSDADGDAQAAREIWDCAQQGLAQHHSDQEADR